MRNKLPRITVFQIDAYFTNYSFWYTDFQNRMEDSIREITFGRSKVISLITLRVVNWKRPNQVQSQRVQSFSQSGRLPKIFPVRSLHPPLASVFYHD